MCLSPRCGVSESALRLASQRRREAGEKGPAPLLTRRPILKSFAVSVGMGRVCVLGGGGGVLVGRGGRGRAGRGSAGFDDKDAMVRIHVPDHVLGRVPGHVPGHGSGRRQRRSRGYLRPRGSQGRPRGLLAAGSCLRSRLEGGRKAMTAEGGKR